MGKNREDYTIKGLLTQNAFLHSTVLPCFKKKKKHFKTLFF